MILRLKESKILTNLEDSQNFRYLAGVLYKQGIKEHLMKSKKTSLDSRVILARVMMPRDANPAGIVHGGVIMKEIDTAAGVAAVSIQEKSVLQHQ